MTSRYAVAPPPPTGPGMVPEDDREIDRYLSELARWRLHREHELQALDALTRTHPHRDDLNGDITDSMTLWHAIAQRHDLLLATWQDTRAGHGEREWVARLMWGMLELPDGDAQALAIALPEALRLSDALAASLRARVQADTDGIPLGRRITAIGRDVRRLRAELEGHGEGAGGDLAEQLARVEDEAAQLRGREGPEAVRAVGDLESRLASVERDLIVGASASAHERLDAEQAGTERDHLVARGQAVRALAQRVLDSLYPAPRLGIPDVAALGDVPTEEQELAAYMSNLERVGRALDQAHATYAAALAEYAHLADRAERLAKTLAGCGAPTSVDLAGMLTATKESLHNRPADIQRASALILAQEAYLGALRRDA